MNLDQIDDDIPACSGCGLSAGHCTAYPKCIGGEAVRAGLTAAPEPCDPTCLAAGGAQDNCVLAHGLCVRKGQPKPLHAGGIVSVKATHLFGEQPMTPWPFPPRLTAAEPPAPTTATVKVTINAKSTMALSEAMRAAIEAERQPGGALHRPTAALKPCRSPYCECEPGKCTHPGFFDARHEPIFKEPVTLHYLIEYGVIRDFETLQILQEAASMGFKIDGSIVDYVRKQEAENLERSVESGAVPAPPEHQAALDAALGLVELPPIRVNRETYESLKVLGLQRGMILQPLVREAIQQMLATSSLADDQPVGWQERQQATRSTWTNWYNCDIRSLDQPRSKVSGGIEYQWRPVYARPEVQLDPDSDGQDGQDGQPSYVQIHTDQYDKLGCCIRLLEMIAKGECDDPAAAAKQELVAHGFWNGE